MFQENVNKFDSLIDLPTLSGKNYKFPERDKVVRRIIDNT